MKLFAVAAVLSTFACGRSADACDRSVAHTLDQALSFDGDVPAELRDARQQLGDALVRLCRDDRWSHDVLDCMDDAADPSASMTCASRLSPDQLRRFQDVLKAAWRR